ncbi:MAG: cytochrome c oxidase subunit II [Beijerinckiaceae bacterium]
MSAATLCGALLAACDAPLSTLDPAGPNADEIRFLWLVMFWGATAISLMVFALALYVSFAGNRPIAPVRALVWGGGGALPIVTLTVLLVLGVRAGDAIASRDDSATQVDITGHRWWWEVAYSDDAGRKLYSANEVHIPAGRPVRFNIRSNDVIHSFWIPRLSGKVDAIPGITNVLTISAFTPGVYRGLCAEFCGAQHARMSFAVHAHDEDTLRTRMQQLASSARKPPAAFERHCGTCHASNPHDRRHAIAAPNLSDMPIRRSIGAGALPNNSSALRDWITQHQRIKPGNRMAVFNGDANDLDEIVAFLEPRK